MLSSSQGSSSQTRSSKSTPFSLVDRKKPYFSGIQRFGVAKTATYLNDPFHTLLNLPWWKFIMLFFTTYVTLFILFAFLYWTQSTCVYGLDGQFSHALWLSSRTSSTLGYNTIQPNPDCVFVNLVVMTQVITSDLIGFLLLGIVFARFSAPYKRAETMKFTKCAVVHRHHSGYWCLTFKVANIRKHQILNPAVKVLLTAIDSITPSNYVFEYLELENVEKDMVNLQLGFPANLNHIITPSSPLYNLSLAELDTRMMEILVFLDGVDAMTSKQMQARKTFNPEDLRMNEQFVPMHLEIRNGKLGMDFSQFDATASDAAELIDEYQSAPQLSNMPLQQVHKHMTHLRHLTFKRLTEQGSRPAILAEEQSPDLTAKTGTVELMNRSSDQGRKPGQPLADVPLL